LESYKKPISLRDLGLKPYRTVYALNRLPLGVDNVHIDVHISLQVHNALKKAAFNLMIKHSGTEIFFKDYKRDSCEIAKDSLRRICNDILLEGINKAKISSEIQIDFLAQTALAKLFLQEIISQYKNLVSQLEPLVRIYQLSERHDQNDIFFIKSKLSEIKLHHHQIIRLVGKELFELLASISTRNLTNMRETHFLDRDILPSYFLTNPLFHTDNPNDDYFLIEEYVLLGQRTEDSDNYKRVQSTIQELFSQIELKQDIFTDDHEAISANNLPSERGLLSEQDQICDTLILEPDNIERMFDYFTSLENYQKAKQTKEPENILEHYQARIGTQKSLLNLFYRKFKRSGLLKLIVADFEMKSVYEKYCPPIAPRKVRECLISFWARISMRSQQKRYKALYGTEFTLAPLLRTVKKIRRLSSDEKKQYLIMYLKHFSRYHRDLYNFRIMKDAMNALNLVTDEKIILLSRENRTLFEFLLPDERITEEKPIGNHVIIKADIRGSMAINSSMRNKGLNAASYFSLNFFNPISSVLNEYAASKVFIEGDAIILSILEREDKEQVNYSVARSCGLAIKILQIVHSYNEVNKENNLPALELGIGISFCDGPPAFLFDGDSKIMISPAISQADRMSSCDKMLRKIFKSQNDIFNVFVFENETEDMADASPEESTYRYNVNGIELNEEGFHKISEEIKLQTFTFPSDNDENVKLHTGKVPLANGSYQRIAIREAIIHKVQTSALDVSGKISKKYYEVCSHREIYDFIEKQA
jgi:hypothetical protein